MKKDKIIEKLYSLHRFGIKPGLERISAVLEFANNPQNSFKSIHIAGTNGKGSTSSLLASILMEAGYKVGLYTSPHLIRFNERIKVNGREIDDDALVLLAEKYLPFSDKVNATFFELTTAMAFDYFANQNVDIAIIETGMGGRFDATNVLKPIVCGITSISLEHKEYLGDSIEKIAFEKGGIIKENIPIVVSSLQDEVIDVLSQIAKEKNSPLYQSEALETVIQHKFLDNLTTEVCVNYGCNLAYTILPLPGSHQIENLQLALSILLKSDIKISLENVSDGIKNVKDNVGLSTRIDLIKSNPDIIVDSAHNEAAVFSLVETLRLHRPAQKYDIVFAAMADKDIPAILSILKPICNRLIITKPEIDRAAKIENIEAMAISESYKEIILTANTKEAVKVMDLSKDNLVVGSFYLTGEILPLLNNI